VSEVTSCDARDRVEEGRGEAEVTGGGACRGEAEEVGGEMGMGERGVFFFFFWLGGERESTHRETPDRSTASPHGYNKA